MTEVNSEQIKQILMKPAPEVLRLMLQLSQSARERPTDAHVIKYENIPSELPTVKPSDFGWLYIGPDLGREYKLQSLEEVVDRMRTWIPDFDRLSFDSYVLAGSFVVLACQNGAVKPNDADYYPVVFPGYPAEVRDQAMGAYQTWLQEFQNIIDEPNHQKPHNDIPFKNKTITTRNERCTSVIFDLDVHRWPDEYQDILEKMQFIHRAHTTISESHNKDAIQRSKVSSVVGFDQIACKAFLTARDTCDSKDRKHEIFFTLDAALSLYFGINPVDWRRESPSHARRIQKYFTYGFTPIFPGLHMDLHKNMTDPFYRFAQGRIKVNDFSTQVAHSERYELTFPEYTKMYEDHNGLVPDHASFNGNDDGEPIECPKSEEYPTEEGDYELDSFNAAGAFYMMIGRAIHGKTDLTAVIADTPTEIIDDFYFMDLPSILRSLSTGRYSSFYMGTKRASVISHQLNNLGAVVHGGTGIMKSMSRVVLARFTVLQMELNDIVESRTAELNEKFAPVLARLKEVKFIISNPGAQFTSSFQPILRAHPRDYFGHLYQDFDIRICYKVKITLLCMRRFCGEFPLIRCDKNIMMMIFFWIDRAYIEHFMKSGQLDVERVPSPIVNHEVSSDVEFSIRASFDSSTLDAF